MINLLPIGSIIKLHDIQKKVMIYGRFQKQEGDPKIWDYLGCMYPEGHIKPENSFLFDHPKIENICYMGFQDAEETEFLNYVEKELKKISGVINITEEI